MSTSTIVLLIVFGSLVVMIACAYLGAYLTRKGISVKKIETTAEKLASWAVSAADALAPYLPSPYSSIALAITKAVARVVQMTEALNDASMLAADQRKAAATNIIVKELTDSKITVDANVQKLISVSIDSACLLLPHHIDTAQAAVASTSGAVSAQ